MEYSIQTLMAVVNQLKSLFADKGELKGFNDWDSFVGCVIALERVIQELQANAGTPSAEE